MLYNIDTEEGREAFTLHWLTMLHENPAAATGETAMDRARMIASMLLNQQVEGGMNFANEQEQQAAIGSVRFTDLPDLYLRLSVLPGQVSEAFGLLVDADLSMLQHSKEVANLAAGVAPKKKRVKRVKTAEELELAAAWKAYTKAESLSFQAREKHRVLLAQYQEKHPPRKPRKPRKKRTE
jgi:hypothetical protein